MTLAAVGSLRNGVSSAINAALAVVRSVKAKITGFFSSAGSWLLNIGRHIVDGLASGIRNGIDKVMSAARALANAIPGPIRNALGISSPSKVTMALGRWIAHGLADGMTGSVSRVAAATKKLTDAISGKLEKHVKGTLNKLKKIAADRERVAGRLAAAKKRLSDAIALRDDFAKSVRDKVLSDANVTNGVNGPTNANLIIAKMQDQLKKTIEFRKMLARLKKMGLNAQTYKDLVEAGVDGGSSTAEALLKGGAAAVTQVNTLQTQIGTAASGLGSDTSKSLYQAGVHAAQGLVKGLESQLKALDKAADRLAKALVKALKKALKIKSPSGVMADQVGRWLPRGIAAGVDADAHVVGASLRKAVPNLAASSLRTAPATGAVTVIQHVTVHGHVLTEKRLADVLAPHVRDAVVRRGRNNGGRTGL